MKQASWACSVVMVPPVSTNIVAMSSTNSERRVVSHLGDSRNTMYHGAARQPNAAFVVTNIPACSHGYSKHTRVSEYYVCL